ncbi:hypothetical protein BS47DRAFT_688448 [Hydnum rufescens UP504]|uniref:Uncharacterized protein n=1 Tax=Hydnum rufescens UP504 TaxID=1448309 RepID=A0A9P6AEX8_9AGAM|nr:hypothetical protein BS47DRAFT_688448 [Hydnum rufescens UP504]
MVLLGHPPSLGNRPRRLLGEYKWPQSQSTVDLHVHLRYSSSSCIILRSGLAVIQTHEVKESSLLNHPLGGRSIALHPNSFTYIAKAKPPFSWPVASPEFWLDAFINKSGDVQDIVCYQDRMVLIVLRPLLVIILPVSLAESRIQYNPLQFSHGGFWLLMGFRDLYCLSLVSSRLRS